MTAGPADRARLVALSLIPGLGGRTLARLIAHFGSPAAILAASTADLLAVPRIGPRLAAAIQAADPAQTERDLIAWQADGIAVLLRGDPAYPALLDPLDDAPPALFWRGLFDPQADKRTAALVGTRSPTPAARQLAGQLAAALVARGWTIVSGLAAGIDSAAHRGALDAGGRTLAVLGCGVRVIYPPESAPLAARIPQHGALLAEVGPDIPPSSPALVARNRLISGLSRAVIVVETGKSGGSLHAARFAHQQGRAVFAVQNGAAGNTHLIADGAHPLPIGDDAAPALLAALETIARPE